VKITDTQFQEMDKKLYLILGSIMIRDSDPFEARSVATAVARMPVHQHRFHKLVGFLILMLKPTCLNRITKIV
jgi:hypothetical protein